MFRSILYNKVSKSTTTPMQRVNRLIEVGLLKETVSEFPPVSKTISLTDKGREVAKRVAEIEELIEG